MLINTFLTSANKISQNYSNPRRVLETTCMRHTVTHTIKLQNACYVADLLGNYWGKNPTASLLGVMFHALLHEVPVVFNTVAIN